MEVRCKEKDILVAKESLKRAQNKFPLHCIIKISKIVPKVVKTKAPRVAKIPKPKPRKAVKAA